MSKDFVLTTDELFGSYCYIEQKRYGVPNEKFLYKIIGKFTSNAWSNVPVDANDKEPHIFNHSEEVINVVCCGVCEDKIERYKLSDVEIISNKDQQLADLEAKLAESEKQIKDAREAGNMAVDSWCKNRRKYEAQIAEMQNKSFILYSMLYETLEKQGCDNVASQIDQMTGWTYDKETDWLKGNRNYDQLKQQLAEKDEQLRAKIGNMKSNDFIKMCLQCGLMVDAKEKNIQDKISFAITELEKVRETAECVLDNALKNSSLNESYYDRLLDEIDNQIAELKKGVE